MAKQLIVSINGREKKIAIIENDKVSEFYIERGEENQGIVGNIYKGRVMRVLPGMQSAFVDIGLERDAFLYVSDFFDEEEEFERIVIDKTKKGATDAEREHQIEASHERAEPLLEAELPVEEVEEQPSETEASKRRGRRGRRRGRSKDGGEEFSSEPQRRVTLEPESTPTPFVAADPSIQRISDDEETLNGEMFKDARLQERIFDQIHAVEFNFEDDFRTVEVGSVLPRGGVHDDSFQRIDDSDVDGQNEPGQIRLRAPVEAHLDSFVEDAAGDTLGHRSFERVGDDEEIIDPAPITRRTRKPAPGDEEGEAKT